MLGFFGRFFGGVFDGLEVSEIFVGICFFGRTFFGGLGEDGFEFFVREAGFVIDEVLGLHGFLQSLEGCKLDLMFAGQGDEFVDRGHTGGRVEVDFLDDFRGSQDAHLIFCDEIDGIAGSDGGQIHEGGVMRFGVEDNLFEYGFVGCRFGQPVQDGFREVVRGKIGQDADVKRSDGFGHGGGDVGVCLKGQLIPDEDECLWRQRQGAFGGHEFEGFGRFGLQRFLCRRRDSVHAQGLIFEGFQHKRPFNSLKVWKIKP